MDNFKALEKKLKTVGNKGYEYVTITQVINWMYEIKRENHIKKHHLDD